MPCAATARRLLRRTHADGGAQLLNSRQLLSTPPAQVLNELNHSPSMRYPIMDPQKPSKVLQRIAGGPDKIQILVRAGRPAGRQSA